MASLRLPRLCCPARDPGTDLTLNSAIYHTVCGSSSVLGLLGLALCYRPTNVTRQSGRMGGTVLLAGSMVTAGLLVQSILWLSIPEFLSDQTYWLSHILCIAISTWIHFFCCVLFWAFFCYSLEIGQMLSPNPSERLGRLFRFLCWVPSSLLFLQGFLMVIPSDKRCDSKQGLVLFHDVILYLPLLLALIASPFLLRRAVMRVPSVLKMYCGVYTRSERVRKHNLCRRLLGINGVFAACWLGNVLCDLFLLPVEVLGTLQAPRQIQVAALTLSVITGILNPTFCCLHSLALFGLRSYSTSSANQRDVATAETPLLSAAEEEAAGRKDLPTRGESAHSSGKLTLPSILQLMDSYSSMEFRCSALEINALRLLGTRDTTADAFTGSEPTELKWHSGQTAEE